MTPGTFNDPSSFVDALPITQTDTPTSQPDKRQSHARKKPPQHIPRPPNAFILFRSSLIRSNSVPVHTETKHSTLSKIFGLAWNRLPHKERQMWYMKARDAMEEHKRKYPQYAFRPLKRQKRKTREVYPDDFGRCSKIAGLLVQGVQGNELNEAVAEYDLHNVPKIDIRFDAPITAGTYCGSPPVQHSKSVSFEKSPPMTCSITEPPNALEQERSYPSQSEGEMPGICGPQPSMHMPSETVVSSYQF